MIKAPGGMLVPADDMELEQLNKFKTGCEYPVEIKLSRNPAFHGKVMAFFRFCFAHWRSDQEFKSETGQFENFRKELTVLAGSKDVYYKLDGSLRVEAKSLSFGAMDELVFQDCYKALIQAAMTNLFLDGDEDTYNQLVGFF